MFYDYVFNKDFCYHVLLYICNLHRFWGDNFSIPGRWLKIASSGLPIFYYFLHAASTNNLNVQCI